MDSTLRKPYQGVLNVVSFNWHYYVLSIGAILLILALKSYLNSFKSIADALILLISLLTAISLAVSFYIYDLSALYKLSWLDSLKQNEHEKIINIHAGFDETSILLKNKFKNSELLAGDFYDPAKHTKISIRRARKLYPSFPYTEKVSTTKMTFPNNSADKIFVIFAAHEIRNDEERIVFFKELSNVLKLSGQIVVTEHLRDIPNFLAYNLGFFHFYSSATWLKTFKLAGLKISNKIKTTPFITTFILEKNGTAS